MDSLQRIRTLFAAIESADLEVLDAMYHDDVVQIEYPNRLLPSGATRDKAAILHAAERGKALLSRQSLVLLQAVEQGDTVGIEAEWSGTLAVDAPPLALRAGSDMRARFAQFVTFRQGRVIRHATYDCFEAWPAAVEGTR